jgi:hypothetical protein
MLERKGVEERGGSNHRNIKTMVLGIRLSNICTLDHHDERKKDIVFQSQRSKVKVVTFIRETMYVG